jgi:hypothetical protein
MIEFSITEIGLFLTNIVSWAMYFKSEERRHAAEYLAKAMIQDKEVRDKIVSEFEAFQSARERST